jgi:hypothetical protein
MVKPAGAAGGGIVTEIDESRLEQLIGVHSSKAGYYAQWRGTKRDLERALAGLRAMSDALCVTALGPVALCDAVLDAVGRLFDAQWAILVLSGADLPATVPSRFTWCGEPAQRARLPAEADSAALAARITDVAQVIAVGEGAPQATVLGVPMRLDHRPVGSLLIGADHSAGRDGIGRDGIGMSILETAANQIVAALRNAWLLEHAEDLRRSWPAGTPSSAGPGTSWPGPGRPSWSVPNGTGSRGTCTTGWRSAWSGSVCTWSGVTATWTRPRPRTGGWWRARSWPARGWAGSARPWRSCPSSNARVRA